jgi:hypothetical protein
MLDARKEQRLSEMLSKDSKINKLERQMLAIAEKQKKEGLK